MVGYVDSFDEHEGGRLLRAVQSEVNRRARALAARHAVNLADYDEDPISRLVILVDDAADVLSRHTAFLPQLIELADRSRHLGLHLILATTQLPRPIEASLKSYANIRVALRMNDSAEAVALMGGRDPVHVSMHTPGRGSIRIADGVAQPVQFASAAATSADLMEITQGLERKFTVDRSYSAPAYTFPFTVSPRDSTGGNEYYDISFVGAPDTLAYTIQAVPTNSQTNDRCGTLTINQLGQKTHTGTGDDTYCAWGT